MIYEYNNTGHRYPSAHRLGCISAPEGNKMGGGTSSFFPSNWSKQKILEETALAFKKAKANPTTYFDAVGNKNAYDVIASDGLIKIRIFYGNLSEVNPLLNGSQNPIIKSSFPNN